MAVFSQEKRHSQKITTSHHQGICSRKPASLLRDATQPCSCPLMEAVVRNRSCVIVTSVPEAPPSASFSVTVTRLSSPGFQLPFHVNESFSFGTISRYTPVAMDTLEKAMTDQKAPWAAKITAAIAVLDRGWGKPTQQVAANVSFFDQMSDEEQRIMLAALEALRDA